LSSRWRVGYSLLVLLCWDCCLLCWAIPVVHHLDREDGVEAESSHNAVQDEIVIDFLKGCEDARQGTEKVVEDLLIID
jgi:hypothetical protein